MTEKELVTKMLDTLVKSRKELANIDLGITKKSLPDLDKIIEHISAPLMIMVMGEFSTGKSTFINAMVGEEVAAMNATPTTAVITKLCYGEEDKIFVHFTNGTEKEYKKTAFKRLTSKTGKKNEDKTHESIEYVERQLPLDMLQYVTIIDSPGLNDINEKHSDTTKKFVNNADTVFWMFNALHAGSKTEVDAMEALTPRLKPIAIINMMDEIDEEEDDPQEFLDNLRVQLKDKVQAVVGISAKYALEGKLEKNETKIEIGNLKELEQVVQEVVLPNRDKFKLNTLMDELGDFLLGISYDLNDMEENNQSNKDIDYEEYLSLKGKIQQSKEAILGLTGKITDYAVTESNNYNEQAMFLRGVFFDQGIGLPKNEAKAEQYWESAALKNHTLAQASLGAAYLLKKDLKKAKYWLEKAAVQDDRNALLGMGILYLIDEKTGECDFIKGNWTKAIPVLEKAAALNEPNANYYLYLCYANGFGVKADSDKALNFLLRASELEYEEAIVALGRVFISRYEDADNESNDDLYKAMDCFTKAAEYGNPTAIFNLGEIYRKYGKEDIRNQKSLQCYKKAALLGDDDAQYWLALYYRNGIGVEKDDAQALVWLQKSSDQENAEAQNMLGRCYEEGWGVEKDSIKAIEWFKKAAEQDYAVAQYNLAWYYHNGKAVKQDYKEAFNWFEKAAEQDNANAQSMLGDYYLAGWGVESSDEQAIYWYKKAAEQGNEHGQMHLGYCFENGYGTEVDIDKAIYWYKKAAEQGDEEAKKKLAELESLDNKSVLSYKNESYFEKCKREAEQGNARAQYELGVCYATGDEVARNDYQAFRWYEQAANKGNAQAQYALANFYAQGRAVTQSTYTALIWYKKAAAQGYKKAELEINRLQNVKDINNFENLKIRAEQGDPEAQYELGIKYKRTGISNTGEVAAAYWFKQAATQGHQKAKLELDKLQSQKENKQKETNLLKDTYIPFKYDPGNFKSCKKAADSGDYRAQYDLALLYIEGTEIRKDDALAVYWCRRSAEQGYALAQYTLATCYLKGVGIGMDISSAKYWYEKAAAQGYAKAELELQRLSKAMGKNQKGNIADNKDTEINYSAGEFNELRRRAEQGDVDAQNLLGFHYECGQIVKGDYQQAVYWYKKAAEKGHAGAEFHLGQCYENGSGIKRNYEQAMYWYRKAAAQGHENAKLKLVTTSYSSKTVKGSDYRKTVNDNASNTQSKSANEIKNNENEKPSHILLGTVIVIITLIMLFVFPPVGILLLCWCIFSIYKGLKG